MDRITTLALETLDRCCQTALDLRTLGGVETVPRPLRALIGNVAEVASAEVRAPEVLFLCGRRQPMTNIEEYVRWRSKQRQ